MKYKSTLLLSIVLLLSVSPIRADNIEWGVLERRDSVISPELIVGNFSHTYEFTLTGASFLIVIADQFNCQCSDLNIANDTFSMILKDSFGNIWADKSGASLC